MSCLQTIEEIAGLLDKSLATTRLKLSPLTESHADLAYPLFDDQRMYAWISLKKPLNIGLLRERWKRLESRLSPEKDEAWLSWFVSAHEDGRAIGCVDAAVDSESVAINLGYYFFPREWGKGYATEAVSAVTKHLMLNGVSRIHATVTVGNAASVKVLKKIGFAYTRVIPGNDKVNGVVVDDEEYIFTGKSNKHVLP